MSNNLYLIGYLGKGIQNMFIRFKGPMQGDISSTRKGRNKIDICY